MTIDEKFIKCLRDTFDYSDGNLIWRDISKYNPKLKNEIAGSLHKSSGYIHLNWKGKTWNIHRLIYAWHHGKFPVGVIDHINGNKSDNRIDNLRDVSLEINRQNIKEAQKNNELGTLGVQKRNNKFRARIRFNKKLHDLGSYPSLQEAVDAYQQAKRLLHKGYIHES